MADSEALGELVPPGPPGSEGESRGETGLQGSPERGDGKLGRSVGKVLISADAQKEELMDVLTEVMGDSFLRLPKGQKNFIIEMVKDQLFSGDKDPAPIVEICSRAGVSVFTGTVARQTEAYELLKRWLVRNALETMQREVIGIVKRIISDAKKGKPVQQKIVMQSLGLLGTDIVPHGNMAPINIVQEFKIMDSGEIKPAGVNQ